MLSKLVNRGLIGVFSELLKRRMPKSLIRCPRTGSITVRARGDLARTFPVEFGSRHMRKPGTTARRGMMTYVAIIFVVACVVAVLYMVIGHPGAPAPEATKISVRNQ